MKDLFKDIIICPYCGVPTKVVWVHGHGQCAICKNVIDECCRGENQQTNKTPDDTGNNNQIKEEKNDEADN